MTVGSWQWIALGVECLPTTNFQLPTRLLLAFVLALFAFSFLAALFAFGFGALVLAFLAFGFLAALLAFSLLALVFAGFAFNLLAALGGVALVGAFVLALLSSGNGGVFGGLGRLVVAAGGHRESKCQSGKSGEKYFLHFFDVFY